MPKEAKRPVEGSHVTLTCPTRDSGGPFWRSRTRSSMTSRAPSRADPPPERTNDSINCRPVTSVLPSVLADQLDEDAGGARRRAHLAADLLHDRESLLRHLPDGQHHASPLGQLFEERWRDG